MWSTRVVLEEARGLSPRALRAVAELERLVVASDGARLKLEWDTLRRRSGDQVEDLLWWEDGQLRGFLGRYCFGGSTPELVGMVAPAARRRGIATALLDAAMLACSDRDERQVLLVVPGTSAAGTALALSRAGVLDHREHALVLTTEPLGAGSDPRVTLRPAVPADATVVGRLREIGFGHAEPRQLERFTTELASAGEQTLVVERDRRPVGTLRLTRDGVDAGVYGFVVDPAWQGRGIGGDVLRRVCRALRAQGAQRIGLEVAVDNDRALGLYTSVGFTRVATEDYYALPVP